MSDHSEYRDADPWEHEHTRDEKQVDARVAIRKFIEANRGRAFYSRQLQVLFERDYFHWITHRALHDLIAEGYLRSEERRLDFGGSMKLLWHSKDRNLRRELNNVAALVQEFSEPRVGESVGWVGEQLVLEAFVRNRFLVEGREARAFGGKEWGASRHDLDFVFCQPGPTRERRAGFL